ncbi:MAG TPA: hypothetical protein VEC12_06255, partial [Bacteroidia bacterium]|nr:hypothetical protein [Bacteroidia bacterium]
EGFVMDGVHGEAISFDVTLIDSLYFKTFSNTGPILNMPVRNAIHQLCEGGKIIITNVRYRLIKKGDTLNYEEPLADNCEITVRSQSNTYTIEGGFSDTSYDCFMTAIWAIPPNGRD